MYTSTDETPVTAQLPEGPGTGAGLQASTQPKATEQAVQQFTAASLAYQEALAARHRADEAMYRALAHAHRVDPFLTSADRMLFAESTDHRAEDAAERALAAQVRVDAMRREYPYLAAEATAVVMFTIRRDRIVQTARLAMGATASATRAWTRVGEGSWRSTDPEWHTHEDRLGVQLVEFMDELSLPSRVASMLPRPPAPGSDAARKAAEEVRRG